MAALLLPELISSDSLYFAATSSISDQSARLSSQRNDSTRAVLYMILEAQSSAMARSSVGSVEAVSKLHVVITSGSLSSTHARTPHSCKDTRYSQMLQIELVRG